MTLDLTIRREKEDYSVNFPYDAKLVEAVKKIPNRRWFAAKKQWIVPRSSAEYFKRWLDEVRAFAAVTLDDGIESELIECAQKSRASVEASRAANAYIDIPCPEGLEYLPFQRAGIVYCLGVFGELKSLAITGDSDANGHLSKNSESIDRRSGEPRERQGDASAAKSRENIQEKDQLTNGQGAVCVASIGSDEKSDERAVSSRETSAWIEFGTTDSQHEFQRREWAGANGGNEAGCQDSSAAWVFDGSGVENKRTPNTTFTTQILQSGLCKYENKDRDRIGRPESFRSPKNSDRQKEDGGASVARVESYQNSTQTRGVLVADEPGLGKTIQAIGVSNVIPAIRSILVICPSSLRLNWQREWRKWCVKQLSVGVAYAGGVIFPTTNVVVINYDILRRHIDKIHERQWDMLICDEAHALKNYKAQRTMLVLGGKEKIKALVAGRKVHAETVEHAAIKASRKLFLTGTPILNRPIEAWTLVRALAPDVFRSWKHYVYRYCGASSDGYGMDVSGATNLPELQDLLRANIMVRRLKVDVLKELPAKRRQVIELPCESAAVRTEQSAVAAMQSRLERLRVAVELAKGGSDDEYRSAVDALTQGSSGAFTELSKLRHETALAKLPMVIEHCKESVESGKIVIFAHHKDVIAAIRQEFPNAAVIVGDTPLHERQAAVDRFQNVETCKVIIGSFGAMSVGLTLTASAHVIFAELDWVPAIMSQAEDRCNRIGQVNSVLAQHLVLDGSLDAVMAHRLVAKQKVIDAALDTEAAIGQEPLLPLTAGEAVTQETTRARVIEEAVAISIAQAEAIHAQLRALAAMCDGAHSADGAGFNRLDTAIGKSLASCVKLTPKQAVLGLKLVTKYRRQLTAYDGGAL